ncbi:MAG: FAD-binding protein [Candidatus Electryonea clarkiae]|nr:FAD-binding protein [Candidatus Electryonea clarkiae]MDP8289147.1 FAD-binding protein [Candidatus Electryonea clarkiae]
MTKDETEISGMKMPVYSINTLIIGSGAAALGAAVNLVDFGQDNIAIVTDGWGGGTSNNAGSDKQTYYRLSMSGEKPDSAYEMAKDLFDGGCVQGDIALCEAQQSAQAFYRLIQLGVPFPHDKFGGFPGYITDHDRHGRGTSAGPLTSRFMFEALAKEVERKNIPVLDQHEIISLLTRGEGDKKSVIGAIALNKNELDGENLGFVIFNSVNTILATGGPAGIYKTSVYPESQTGSHGLAFRAGAIGQNLTESQFGLSSTKFRWNVSGSYQQVIPRYISTDQNGKDQREFLNDCFPDLKTLINAIFLKGYQWPFDVRKIENYGSSLIDLLVYQEIEIKGRRVFLDYKNNPANESNEDEFSFSDFDSEAYNYLEKSDALEHSPIERLQKLNQPSINLFMQHGIDLRKEFLEIAVCAQHNNGGLKGNIWWESNIKHLFPIGEVNGSHGVYRPGGASLNAGQVGGIRSAMFISRNYSSKPLSSGKFNAYTKPQILMAFDKAVDFIDKNSGGKTNISRIHNDIRTRMSHYGSLVRNHEEIRQAVSEAWELNARINTLIKIDSVNRLPEAFKIFDLCLTQVFYLEAIKEYLEKGGGSRGSFIVVDQDGTAPCKELDEQWRFKRVKINDFINNNILQIQCNNPGKEITSIAKKWIGIKPIPNAELWFEKVWKEFRNGNIIKRDTSDE